MCCFNNGCCRCNSWRNGNNNRWPSDQEVRESYERAFNEGRNRCGGREFYSDNDFNDNFSRNFNDNLNDNFSRNFNDNLNDNFSRNFNDNLNDNFSNNLSNNFSNNSIFFINVDVDDIPEVL